MERVDKEAEGGGSEESGIVEEEDHPPPQPSRPSANANKKDRFDMELNSEKQEQYQSQFEDDFSSSAPSAPSVPGMRAPFK